MVGVQGSGRGLGGSGEGWGSRRGLGGLEGVGSLRGGWGEGGGLAKVNIHNMFAIIQSIFSFTHKKYRCVLNKSLRSTE